MLTFALPLGNELLKESRTASGELLCARRVPANITRLEVTNCSNREDIRTFVENLRGDFAAHDAIVFERCKSSNAELEQNLRDVGFAVETHLGRTVADDADSMIYLTPEANVLRSRPPTTDHVSIRVASIEIASKFYGLLGFYVVKKFLTSGVRAVWLVSEHLMLEAIEMPPEDALPPHDLWNDAFRRGLYHISLDVTSSCSSIAKYLGRVEAGSKALYERRIRILDGPRQRMLFDVIVEIAFIADPDGTVIELIRRTGIVTNLEPDW
eukprot:Plantae.Rhodophyta-Purpureofilum_apyrenoidigerum.ctg7746.p1 GENE.Plantae.Rhodophyta-Purpureofilum_apyrenoidigerum.ctg7746~~Plantae.Rhodophyta-Purpureofilum_apyrenoidigerum.ctg7746.p1  ORF type:complete len:268 (+),score=40.91 Plantae.Rhodophyta-Purpureofilum_apyrenoidigerum.ctg7746:191-994(+)